MLVALTRCLFQILLSTFSFQHLGTKFESYFSDHVDFQTGICDPFDFFSPDRACLLYWTPGHFFGQRSQKPPPLFLSDFEQILQNSNWNYVNGYFENARGKHKRANKTLIR